MIKVFVVLFIAITFIGGTLIEKGTPGATQSAFLLLFVIISLLLAYIRRRRRPQNEFAYLRSGRR